MNRLAKAILYSCLSFIYALLDLLFLLLRTVSKKLDGEAEGYIKARIDNSVSTVERGLLKLKFYTPNRTTIRRAKTLFTKEPETLRWIDKFGGGGAFFDIGANIGLYSVYFGLTKPGQIFAFEPSFFNVAMLSKNLHINGLSDRASIIPNPLSDNFGVSRFILQSIEEGGALSAFGVDYGFRGLPLKPNMQYRTLGFSLDWLFEKQVLREYPELIKIDVDGIEHLIIEGARETLLNHRCKSVLIEVNSSFLSQGERIARILSECRFSLLDTSSGIYEGAQDHEDSRNQIWIKA